MLQDILTNAIVLIVMGFTGLVVMDCTNHLVYYWLTFNPESSTPKPAVESLDLSVNRDQKTAISFVEEFDLPQYQQPLKIVVVHIPDPWDLPLENTASV